MQQMERIAYMVSEVISLDLSVRKLAPNLHEAALERVGGNPCLVAAKELSNRVKSGHNVFLITGFPTPPTNVCETDGPLGAYVLAQVFESIGANPVFITDNNCRPVIEAIAEGVPVETIPFEHEQASERAERLIAEYSPTAIIAIQRPGWNIKRVYHGMRGLDISSSVGKTDYLFEQARKKGILTIGIGDGGNELGFGLIRDAVRKYVPYGERCICQCGAGIAAATPADIVIVAGTSNWGAYGLAAILCLIRQMDYRHNGERELELLNKLTQAGSIDGITGKSTPTVDGISTLANKLVVDLIWSILREVQP